jgi:hypothetical protein
MVTLSLRNRNFDKSLIHGSISPQYHVAYFYHSSRFGEYKRINHVPCDHQHGIVANSHVAATGTVHRAEEQVGTTPIVRPWFRGFEGGKKKLSFGSRSAQTPDGVGLAAAAGSTFPRGLCKPQ